MQPMRVGCSADIATLHSKLRCSILLPENFLHLVLKTWLTHVTSSSIERNKWEKNDVLSLLPPQDSSDDTNNLLSDQYRKVTFKYISIVSEIFPNLQLLLLLLFLILF